MRDIEVIDRSGRDVGSGIDRGHSTSCISRRKKQSEVTSGGFSGRLNAPVRPFPP